MLRRAGFAIAAMLLFEGTAAAYCRSSVCNDGGMPKHGKVCYPNESDDCGVPLQWRQPCVGFALQKNGSNQIALGDIDATVQQAFASWTGTSCGDPGSPSIQVFDFGRVDCDKIEYNQHAGNANVIIFRDTMWPNQDSGQGSTDTIALTTVTYDIDKGDIFDADVEVNSANNTFTTSDMNVEVDLLSVLTHEMGHFLGLAHSSEEKATMVPNYMNGSINLRTLQDDDILAICAVYPPGRKADGLCDGLPRHGFAPECAKLQTEAQCAVGRAGDDRDGGLGWSVAAALAALAARRRAARRASYSA